MNDRQQKGGFFSRPLGWLAKAAEKPVSQIKTMFQKKAIKTEILINLEALETRVAFLNDGRLEDYLVQRKDEDRIVGSIFKGRIQNLEDGLQAAFIDIGLKKNAFIHYWDMIPEDTARLEAEEGVQRSGGGGRRKKFEPGEIARLFPIGSEIVVQVTKGAIGTKGPRVTANLSVPGRYLVMMPGTGLKGVSRKIENEEERTRLKRILVRLPTPSNLGFIIRTAGEGARKVSFVRDLRSLLDIWNQIDKGIKETPAPCRLYSEPDLVERVVRDSLTDDVDRIVIDNRDEFERVKEMVSRLSRRLRRNLKLYDGDTPVFDHFDVEKQIDNAFSRKVWLPGGGYLIFDETEALVAIDINTGRHKGGKTQEDTIFEVNIESALEIARQLKLRNVGGLVVIDFIDMHSRKNRQLVYKTLKDALRTDKARTNLLPISELGLLEMTRQRTEESIRSSSHMDCPYCHGRGKIKSEFSISVTLQRHMNEAFRKQRSHNVPLDIKVVVHPAILERLKTDEQILLQLEQKFGGHMKFQTDPTLHMEEFTILGGGETPPVLFTNVDKGLQRF